MFAIDTCPPAFGREVLSKKAQEGLSQSGCPARVSSAEAPSSPAAAGAALGIQNDDQEERAMSNPSHSTGPVRAALRDTVLTLGGVVAVRQDGDDLVEAITHAFGAVVRRHLPQGAGKSKTMNSTTCLRPHPAIAELLEQIGQTPATTTAPTTPMFGDDEWLRLPGLFRRWEIEQVIDREHDFYIEDAGQCVDGTSLLAIYTRSHEPRRNDR